MDNKIPVNRTREKFFDRRLKTLTLIAFLILVWIIVIHFFSGYIKSNIQKSWNEISVEKDQQQSRVVSDLFNEYQSDVNNLSEKLTNNPDLRRQVQRSDPKKLFEELFKSTGKNFPSLKRWGFIHI